VPSRLVTNNKITPANNINVDVTTRAIEEIVPTFQRRYYNAFVPQGITCIAYNRLNQGRKCNCQASRKQLNGLLDEDGKADVGTINRMLTGDMSFDITPYGQNWQQNNLGQNPANGATSPFNTGTNTQPGNQNIGVFDIVTPDLEFPFADVNPDEEAFGDNGPSNPVNIDDLIGDFDTSVLGFSDVACPICFGSGFVGGYAPFHSNRQVYTVADLELINGEIDTTERPWVAREVLGFNQKIILPRGALLVDAFKVWNGLKVVPCQYKIDNVAITSFPQLLQYCDGKPHLVTAIFTGDFTHFEIQFTMSQEQLYFEFPKRPRSADTSLLEQMEPFQIIMSPNIPHIASMDVIVESQLGKVLVVQNTNPWVTRQRNILGPECQVRVIQPQEIFRILPTRGRVPTRDQTSKLVRDNGYGASDRA
jgi:hypothetical protein